MELRAWWQLEPRGDRRMDAHFASLTARLVSLATGNPDSPRNYLPRWSDPWADPDEPTAEEIARSDRAVRASIRKARGEE